MKGSSVRAVSDAKTDLRVKAIQFMPDFMIGEKGQVGSAARR